MSGGIVQPLCLIMASCNDALVQYYHGAYGNFTIIKSFAGFFQGLHHVVFIRHAMKLLQKHYLYFQCLLFPSVSHSIVVSMRLSRVASVFASVIHSMYSRLCDGLKFSKVFCAVLFFFKAA